MRYLTLLTYLPTPYIRHMHGTPNRLPSAIPAAVSCCRVSELIEPKEEVLMDSLTSTLYLYVYQCGVRHAWPPFLSQLR